MESINAESFIENCYEIFERVSFGEKIQISTEYGIVVLVPEEDSDKLD
jgi:hypothetical protein